MESGLRYSRRSQDFKRSVIQYYLYGYSTNECSEKFNIGRSTVLLWLTKAKLLRPAKIYQDEIKKQVITYYLDGHSYEQCAKKFWVSSRTIRSWLKAIGKGRTKSEGIVAVGAHMKGKVREKHPNFKGGRYQDHDGRICVLISPNRYRFEHDLIAEKVLSRPLLRREIVHHVNEDPSDNRNSNLLICTRGYHNSLHHRMRTL